MWLRVFACTLVAILIIVAFVGNTLIIVYFRRCKTLRAFSVGPLIQQLALCGFFMSCCDSLTLVALWLGEHPAHYHPILCNVHFMLGSLSYPVSFWTIAAIALMLLLKARGRPKSNRLFATMMTLPWLLAMCCQLVAWSDYIWPEASFLEVASHVRNVPLQHSTWAPNDVYFCDLNGSMVVRALPTVTYITNGMLPCFLCILFLSLLCRMTQGVEAQTGVTRSVRLIFLTLLLTGFPYIALIMFDPDVPDWLAFLVTALGITNNTFNFFIYGFSCKPFRLAIEGDLERLIPYRVSSGQTVTTPHPQSRTPRLLINGKEFELEKLTDIEGMDREIDNVIDDDDPLQNQL